MKPLLLLAALTALAIAGPAGKPNIILIYADDIGFGDFSSYGGTAIQTPNVDRVASAACVSPMVIPPHPPAPPPDTRCSPAATPGANPEQTSWQVTPI